MKYEIVVHNNITMRCIKCSDDLCGMFYEQLFTLVEKFHVDITGTKKEELYVYAKKLFTKKFTKKYIDVLFKVFEKMLVGNDQINIIPKDVEYIFRKIYSNFFVKEFFPFLHACFNSIVEKKGKNIQDLNSYNDVLAESKNRAVKIFQECHFGIVKFIQSDVCSFKIYLETTIYPISDVFGRLLFYPVEKKCGIIRYTQTPSSAFSRDYCSVFLQILIEKYIGHDTYKHINNTFVRFYKKKLQADILTKKHLYLLMDDDFFSAALAKNVVRLYAKFESHESKQNFVDFVNKQLENKEKSSGLNPFSIVELNKVLASWFDFINTTNKLSGN